MQPPEDRPALSLADLEPGFDFGSLDVAVSGEANDRYWRGVGVVHPLRAEGVLYPPMAVNFTILLVQRTLPGGLLHTRQSLRCHATATAPDTVRVTGHVEQRFDKRGRAYIVVASEVRGGRDELLWSSEAELAAPRRHAPAEAGVASSERGRRTRPFEDHEAPDDVRRLTLTADLLRTYSRAGNFHSDDDAAREMGLPGMVAMGMQTLGPAYGAALDTWGRDFAATGALTARFFGQVSAGTTVENRIRHMGDYTHFDVLAVSRDTPAATPSPTPTPTATGTLHR
jgi:acyl dehydratase